MRTRCPGCEAALEIADQKRGRRVRCGACGETFVAEPARGAGGGSPSRARGARRGPSSGPGASAIVGVAVGAVALAVIAVFAFGGEDGAPVPPRAEAAEARDESADEGPSPVGWDGAYLRAVRAIHEAVQAGDRAAIRRAIHEERMWERDAESARAADPSLPDAWRLLTPEQRLSVSERWVDEIASDEELVAGWIPFDGRVVEESEDEVVVRLEVRSAEGGGVKRTVEWHLERDGSEWLAHRWERWLSDAEKRAMELAERRAKPKPFERKTLSDGSKVIEREPERLEHLEDTPAELRERIDSHYARLLAVEDGRASIEAHSELAEIGWPALPVLLTGLYEIEPDTLDRKRQVNLILQTARKISGQDFGWKPLEDATSSFGTTAERRESAIKQWFAWWYVFGSKMRERPERELTPEELDALTPKERREYERQRGR